MQRWHVVLTVTNGEARALDNLQRQGFEAYLPRIEKQRRHARKVETVLRPLFPRYLFVRFDPAGDHWRPILSTYGVTTLLRRGPDPLPVPAGIVESIQSREAAGELVARSPLAGLKPGDKVMVAHGPFADATGELVSMTEERRVAILLDLLGGKVLARFPRDQILPTENG